MQTLLYKAERQILENGYIKLSKGCVAAQADAWHVQQKISPVGSEGQEYRDRYKPRPSLLAFMMLKTSLSGGK